MLDENLPKNLWKALQAAGYPTARLIDEGLRGCSDSVIFNQVRFRTVIITRDKDFLKTDLFPIPHSGIIVVRLPNGTSIADIIHEVINALATLSEEDLANKIYIIEQGRVRLML